MSDQLTNVLRQVARGLAELADRVAVLEVKRHPVTGGGPVVDHGALGGLGDDDHPQYETQAESDARYAQLGHTHDHGTLSGLAFDDHTQYLNQAEGDARYALLGHAHPAVHYVNISFGGASGTIATGPVPGVLHVPFSGTLTAWALLCDAAGTIVLDLWKCSYAQFQTGVHPVDADSMCGGHEPQTAAGDKAQDLDLSDWAAVAVAAGDAIRVNVDANDTVPACTLSLTFTT